LLLVVACILIVSLALSFALVTPAEEITKLDGTKIRVVGRAKIGETAYGDEVWEVIWSDGSTTTEITTPLRRVRKRGLGAVD